jgi:hypothetical protein
MSSAVDSGAMIGPDLSSAARHTASVPLARDLPSLRHPSLENPYAGLAHTGGDAPPGQRMLV